MLPGPLSWLVPQPENRFKIRTAPFSSSKSADLEFFKISSAVEIKPYLFCQHLPVELFIKDKDEEGALYDCTDEKS